MNALALPALPLNTAASLLDAVAPQAVPPVATNVAPRTLFTDLFGRVVEEGADVPPGSKQYGKTKTPERSPAESRAAAKPRAAHPVMVAEEPALSLPGAREPIQLRRAARSGDAQQSLRGLTRRHASGD